MKKLLFTILFVFSLMSICYADFSIEMQNPTDTKIHFTIYWLDHPFTNIHNPFAVGGGELLPQEKFKFSSKYPDKTQWAIQWDGRKKPCLIFFNISTGTTRVIIKYKKIIIEKGA